MSSDPDERVAIARAFDTAPRSWNVTLHDEAPSGVDVVVYGAGVPGDRGIRFDPEAPHALLDEVRRALERGPRCIVVTGAGGGTGVTSLSLHLAASLASSSRSVLVDLDVQGGAGDRLGLDPTTVRTWGDAETEQDLKTCALPVAGGFRVLLAPRGGDAAGAVTVLEDAKRCFQRVVVDVPCGPYQETALAAADIVVIVVVPALPAARRARALLDRLDSNLRCAVVVNRLGAGGETTSAELRTALGRSICIELPCCPALRDAEDRGALLSSPLHRWRRRATRLARALEVA